MGMLVSRGGSPQPLSLPHPGGLGVVIEVELGMKNDYLIISNQPKTGFVERL